MILVFGRVTGLVAFTHMYILLLLLLATTTTTNKAIIMSMSTLLHCRFTAELNEGHIYVHMPTKLTYRQQCLHTL